jgi:hypothetical protein
MEMMIGIDHSRPARRGVRVANLALGESGTVESFRFSAFITNGLLPALPWLGPIAQKSASTAAARGRRLR